MKILIESKSVLLKEVACYWTDDSILPEPMVTYTDIYKADSRLAFSQSVI